MGAFDSYEEIHIFMDKSTNRPRHAINAIEVDFGQVMSFVICPLKNSGHSVNFF